MTAAFAAAEVTRCACPKARVRLALKGSRPVFGWRWVLAFDLARRRWCSKLWPLGSAGAGCRSLDPMAT